MPPLCSMWIINNDRIWLEPWRFIGYGFVHNTYLHLAGNVVSQLFFGLPLELSNGSIRIAYVYLSGMFLAGLGRVMTTDRSSKPLAGASGKKLNAILKIILVLKQQYYTIILKAAYLCNSRWNVCSGWSSFGTISFELGK